MPDPGVNAYVCRKLVAAAWRQMPANEAALLSSPGSSPILLFHRPPNQEATSLPVQKPGAPNLLPPMSSMVHHCGD